MATKKQVKAKDKKPAVKKEIKEEKVIIKENEIIVGDQVFPR